MPIFDPKNLQAETAKVLGDSPTPNPPTTQVKTSGIGKGPYIASAVGNGLDALTTALALHSGKGAEGNPLLPGNIGANLAVKGLGTLGMLLLMRQIAKNHPTAAKILGYGDGAAMGAVAAHNALIK